jgi:hypothetical protein
MEIVYKKAATCPLPNLTEVAPGTVFTYHGTLFMPLKGRVADTRTLADPEAPVTRATHTPVVRLEDGLVTWLNNNVRVEPVPSRLVIT